MEWNRVFLLLKRSIASPQGGLWTAAPGGKIESGETPLQAVVREIREETSICRREEQITFIHTVYYQYPDSSYKLHLFYSHLDQKPEVHLDEKEHTEYSWKTLRQARTIPIMRGGKECITFVLDWLEGNGKPQS
jgi:8-oxo-dGTP diphosphatase